MNQLGQVNPVGGLNLLFLAPPPLVAKLANTFLAPPPLVATSNSFRPLSLQGNKDNRLDGADAG